MSTSRRPRSVLAGVAGLVLLVALAGCSGDDDPETGSPSPSVTASASETASETATDEETYLPVPDGVELTDQGSALELGDTATVAYKPTQNKVGVLDITVSDLRSTTFKQSFQGWKLSKEIKSAAPYFVTATFKNVGDSDLGGQRPPLYIVDGEDTLVESSSFVTTFKPCPSTSFPKKFKPGQKVKRCLVFLAPDDGELVSASFRPAQEFNPITWSGDVLKLGAKAPGSGDKKSKKSKKSEKKG